MFSALPFLRCFSHCIRLIWSNDPNISKTVPLHPIYHNTVSISTYYKTSPRPSTALCHFLCFVLPLTLRALSDFTSIFQFYDLRTLKLISYMLPPHPVQKVSTHFKGKWRSLSSPPPRSKFLKLNYAIHFFHSTVRHILLSASLFYFTIWNYNFTLISGHPMCLCKVLFPVLTVWHTVFTSLSLSCMSCQMYPNVVSKLLP